MTFIYNASDDSVKGDAERPLGFANKPCAAEYQDQKCCSGAPHDGVLHNPPKCGSLSTRFTQSTRIEPEEPCYKDQPSQAHQLKQNNLN